MEKLKGIIFDLDGTLVNTIEDLCFCLGKAMENQGWEALDQKQVIPLVGHGMKSLVEKALLTSRKSLTGTKLGSWNGDGQDHRFSKDEIFQWVPEVLEDFLRIYREDPARFSKPYPGLKDFLSSLEKDIPIGVLSNKDQEFLPSILQKAYPGHRFSPVYGKRPGVPHKPDPHGLGQIAEEWGLSTRDLVYVGDSEVDIQTAKAAGMGSLAVSWGFRSEEALRACEPDFLVRTTKELADAIQTIKNKNH